MTVKDITLELTSGNIERFPLYDDLMKTWFERDIKPLILSGTDCIEYTLDSSRGLNIARILKDDYNICEFRNFEYFADWQIGVTDSQVAAEIIIYLTDRLGYNINWNLLNEHQLKLKINLH